MKRCSVVRLAVSCGVTIAACGCAQLAGLTGDYEVGNPGAGAQIGMAGAGDVGASGGDAGASGEGGASGERSAHGGAPAAGSANGGAATAGNANGGTSGAASGGTSAGGANVGGMSVAGAGGAVSTAGGPVFISSTQFHDSASGDGNAAGHLSDATFDKPPGLAEGDFMLAFFGVDHHLSNVSTDYFAAQGWTLFDQQGDYGGDGQGTYLLYKFAGASEPAQIVIAGLNTNHFGLQGLLSAYRGVNTASPVNVYKTLVVPAGDDVAQVDTPTPEVTTTVAHCLVIVGLSPDTTIDAPVIATWPLGFDENHVSVINPPNPFPDGWANIFAAERHVAAAGKVAQASFVWNITAPDAKKFYGSLAFTLALAPAP